MSDEVWVPVNGYEGLYEVSSIGRVRSLDRITEKVGLRKGRILTPRKVSAGYQQVTLCNDDGKKQLLVHRIVCRAFNGEPPDGKYQVDHLNKVRDDNRASNLEWVSASENMSRIGTFWGKLKPVVRIDPDGSEHLYPGRKFAVADGYNSSAICRCINGERDSVNGIRWRDAL